MPFVIKHYTKYPTLLQTGHSPTRLSCNISVTNEVTSSKPIKSSKNSMGLFDRFRYFSFRKPFSSSIFDILLE